MRTISENIKKLCAYYKPYKKILILDLILLIIWSSLMVLTPLVIRYVTNEILTLEKFTAIKKTTIFLIIILAIFAIVFMCEKFMRNQGAMISVNIEKDLSMDLFKKCQKMSFSFYDNNKIGKLMSLFTNDINRLAFLLKEAPEFILDFAIRFFGTITVLLFINIKFVLITIGLLSIFFVFIWYFFPKVQKKSILSNEMLSLISSDLEEELSGIKTSQAFANEEFKYEKFYNNVILPYVKNEKELFKLESIFMAGFVSMMYGTTPLITIISIFLIINEIIVINDLITLTLYVSIITGPLWNMIGLFDSFQKGLAGLKRVFNFLEIKTEIYNSINPVDIEKIKGEIEFQNIIFKYEKSDKNIFENFSLKINSGEYIALVGHSGSGKSTLCNLIPRFYDISDGKILIDGIDIKNIKLKKLRQNIGFVQQDTFLFSGTIFENIRYGKSNASEDKVIEAAKNAYADDFIMSLPAKYDTQIGQRGVKLSGGQKQRLAIARVFLKNPPILIFDEATSSLDNESERFIYKSFEKLTKNRTTIVIAHRLSTIRNAKRILVMVAGKIAEEGTHEELIIQNGIYKEFYDLK